MKGSGRTISNMVKESRSLLMAPSFKATMSMASQRVLEGMHGPTVNFMKESG